MIYSQLILSITTAILLAIPQWSIQESGVQVRLRGVSAVNDLVAWASGADNTVLRTADGGETWQKLTVIRVEGERVDFRDIDAVDTQTAYVLSIGNGAASRIYKTNNGGATWVLQFQNREPKAFYDAMSFWDFRHGIVIGDAIDGKFYILRTENGGKSWVRVPEIALPPALQNEGAFAASGTNIAVIGKRYAWIGTGAAARARVLRTTDGGRTWKISETPLISGPSAGIFSVAFRDEKHGVIVGGDYTKENEARDNLAVTSDGGATWSLVRGLSGFRSAVAYVPAGQYGRQSPMLIAVGPAGADYSTDDGRTWSKLDGPGFDTLSFAPGRPTAWAAGARGILGRLTWK